MFEKVCTALNTHAYLFILGRLDLEFVGYAKSCLKVVFLIQVIPEFLVGVEIDIPKLEGESKPLIQLVLGIKIDFPQLVFGGEVHIIADSGHCVMGHHPTAYHFFNSAMIPQLPLMSVPLNVFERLYIPPSYPKEVNATSLSMTGMRSEPSSAFASSPEAYQNVRPGVAKSVLYSAASAAYHPARFRS